MLNSALINVMTRAVMKASKGLVRDFSEVDKLQISKKGTANFVTSADLRTEKILIEELSHARKYFGFITEESGVIEGSDSDGHVWIIDPIDGTTNFIHAIPYFCVSVAAAKKQADGSLDVIAGVIYDPIHDELFTAEKGLGAELNGHRLRVSPRTEDLLLSTTAPRRSRENYDEVEQTLQRVTASGATVRCSGAAALDLAYVAAGRYDGIWYHTLKQWDIAAGLLMVSEAGGRVTAIDGSNAMLESGSIVASNGKIHSLLQGMLIQKAA